ncbi:hypothetical protein ACX12M_20030 [Cellulosimicrobium cellulans]
MSDHRKQDGRRPEASASVYALILFLLVVGGGQSPDIASCVADLAPVIAMTT